MTEDRLAEFIRATASELEAAFSKTAAIQHQGQMGASREDRVLDLVRSRLPGTVVATGSGEVIDSAGTTSKQQDILIVDPATPPFFDGQSHRVFPAECVHGVIEVKSVLHKADVVDACEKIASVKRLPKIHYYPDPLGRTFTGLDGSPQMHRPTFGYVFAFSGGAKIETLSNNVIDWCAEHPAAEWPDGLFILGRGTIGWFKDGTFHESVVQGGNIGFLDTTHSRDVLLTLALVLHQSYVTAWSPPFRLHGYLPTASLGLAKWSDAPSWNW